MFRELVTGSKERLMASSTSKAYVFSTELIFANILVFEERLAKVDANHFSCKTLRTSGWSIGCNACF
jgi:hypothetical protein